MARYADNKNIWQNLWDGFPHPYTLSDAERFISTAMGMNPQTYFAIVSGDEAMGSIGFILGTGVRRYTAKLYHTNQTSIRVFQKAGFVREGIKKASVMKAGKVLDQIVYASTRL